MSSVGQVVGMVVGGIVGFFNPALGIALGAAIGGAIGSAIDPPKGPHTEGPRLNDRRVQVSSYGHELPRLYGTMKTAGCIIWLENDEYTEHEVEEEQGGKGGGGGATSTQWTYSATFAVALATCPSQQVAGLRRMWIAGQLVYDAASGNAESTMASVERVVNLLTTSLKSNDTPSTGALSFTFYNGSDTQLPDSRWQADKGVNTVSGLPGVCYIVFHDLDLTEKYGNSLMAAQVECEIVAEPVTVAASVEILAYTNVVSNTNELASVRFTESAVEYAVYDYDTFYGDLNGVHFYRNDFYQREIQIGHCAKAYGNNERFLRIFVRQAQDTCALVQHKMTIAHTESNLMLYLPGATEPQEGPVMTFAQFPDETTLKQASVDSSAGEIFVFSREAMKIYRFNGLVLGDSTVATYTLSDLGYSALYLYGVKYEESVAASTVTIYKFDRADLSLLETWTGTANAHCLALHVVADDVLYTGNATTGEVLKWANGVIVANLGTALPPYLSLEGLAFHNGWFSVFRDEPPYVLSHRAYTDPSNGIYACVTPIAAQATGLRALITRECALVGLAPADLDLASLTDHAVAGYAAIGSPRASLEPLQVAYLFDVFSSGYKLKFVSRGTASVLSIPEADLGATDGEPIIMLKDSREMDEQLPTATTILYLDAGREYETGEQTVYQPGLTGVAERRVELAVVMTADQAAQTADRLNKLARAERSDLSFTLPGGGDYRKLEPTDVVTVTHRGRVVECRLTRIEEFPDGRRECAAKPTSVAAYTSTALGAYPMVNGAVLLGIRGISDAVMLDIPRIVSTQDTFGIAAAVYGYAAGWPGGVLVRSDDGGATWTGNTGFTVKGEAFTASTVLGTGRSDVVDFASSVTVTPDWTGADLFDVSWTQLMSLGNLAAFGAAGRWEILAFMEATASGDDYILSGFLRGLYGSEHAMPLHEVGDRLVMLDLTAIDYMTLPSSALASPRPYRAVTIGDSITNAAEQIATCEGVSLKPLSPCYFRAYRNPSTYDWHVSWYYRSRLPVEPFNGVDTPLGEASERYNAELWNSTFTTLIRSFTGLTSAALTYTNAQQITDNGGLLDTIYMRVTQVSAAVGDGYALQSNVYNYALVDEYGPEILALSPIGFYKLNESSGLSLADSSTQNNTATATVGSGLTYGQASLLPSGLGTCLGMTYARIEIPRLAAMDGAFSLVFPFKIDHATGASQCLVHKGEDFSFTATGGFTVEINTSYNLRFSYYNSAGTYYFKNTTSAITSLNAVQHIVITYDGALALKVYKNGTLFEAFTLTSAIQNTTFGVKLGQRRSSSTWDNGFRGYLDDFAWIPSELTSTQISNLYAKA